MIESEDDPQSTVPRKSLRNTFFSQIKSVKTSPFLFLGGSRGMFSLRRLQEGNGNARELPQEKAAKPEGAESPRGFRG
jgi:hypothetical protein